jgi:Asp-tRNA(Asn)/Glu-tRNA(Gln) amidotransferase A subunit family amidase
LIDEITSLDATGLAAGIRTGELSPVEVMRAHLERIHRLNPDLNAIVTMLDQGLLRHGGSPYDTRVAPFR